MKNKRHRKNSNTFKKYYLSSRTFSGHVGIFFDNTLKKLAERNFFDRISQIIARGILFCPKVFFYPLNFILTFRMKLWHSCQKKSPSVWRVFTRSTNKYLIKYVSSVQSDFRFEKSVANFLKTFKTISKIK